MTEDPLAAIETFSLVAEAVGLLERHPLIGRPVAELRELVISRGRSGYVALYSFELADDAVLLLSIRHQREAGFAGLEP
jgi:plasmid stabilization system protein ParE